MSARIFAALVSVWTRRPHSDHDLIVVLQEGHKVRRIEIETRRAPPLPLPLVALTRARERDP